MQKTPVTKTLAQILFLTFLLISLTSCVSAPSRLVNQELPSQPLTIDFPGFSISTPNESGWILAFRNEQILELVKRGTNKDESYAIEVMQMINLPQLKEDDDFLSFMSEELKKDTNQIRFIEQVHDVSTINTMNGKCIKFVSLHKDLDAKKQTKNAAPMLLEAFGLICRNPVDITNAVFLTYSNRYYSGNQDPSLSDKADTLFKSLKFISNKPSSI